MAQHELIAAGFGGQGVMMLGKLFADSAVIEGDYAIFLPSYGPAMRGGTANCTVITSEEEIASPVLANPANVVVFNFPSFTMFEKSVKKGGNLIVNSSLIKEKSARDDINVVYVPAQEIAEKAGMAKATNIVLLGALLKVTKSFDLETTKRAIKDYLGESKAKYLDVNIKALEAGYNFDGQ
ncbi:MAG TPA: 2-oxoacid:acceptor oxidoreductase family protein [Caldisericia bacterium]|nr:2-oxoacid:acceptor oxidoreductase family protein [Caldisericia bacterium]HPF49375.1 2-oxoacid:acceptor oxidoreductase family protein [Caldisericia bacterium]HPI84451.1 2-oxoacid:acceptor oxidoreductase family protein [Caldisericia bacterium]HPQ93788.1 2-oxoacid:acceptor oxidoreductase family protein [Caldisericia bacterium]HRV75648.1 2-oxoacid:acceptor oxidoreductase family protein [Caldisericia bacterium]